MSKNVDFTIKKDIAIITLKNEKKLNAWNSEMRASIIDFFKRNKKNKNIKAIIFTGSGAKAFCSGQDLNELKNFSGKSVIKWLNQFKILYTAIKSCEIPIIGAINGVAAGSGFQLALLTDVRVSHKTAKFGQVEINSGIVSVIGPWIIEKVLGYSNSVELCLTGSLYRGKIAKDKGIVHYITTKKNVMKKSIQIAKELASKPNIAMRLTKKRLYESFKKDMDKTFEIAINYHKKSFISGEPQKITKKFLNK